MVKLRTTFHNQTDGQVEHTDQILGDMLRASIFNFNGNRDKNFPLVVLVIIPKRFVYIFHRNVKSK